MIGRMRIFTYHEPETVEPWRQLCLESWERHHPGFVVVHGRDTFEAYYRSENGRAPGWDDWLPTQRAAFVHAYMAEHVGGVWLSPDTVMLRPLTPIANALRVFDAVVTASAYTETQLDIEFVAYRPAGRVSGKFWLAMSRMDGRSMHNLPFLHPRSMLSGIVMNSTSRFPIMKLHGIMTRQVSEHSMHSLATDEGDHASKIVGNPFVMPLGEHTGGKLLALDRDQLLASGAFFCHMLRRGLGVEKTGEVT